MNKITITIRKTYILIDTVCETILVEKSSIRELSHTLAKIANRYQFINLINEIKED